jgi:DNA helicase-2/ATP-dependent DNA helicase PcrA
VRSRFLDEIPAELLDEERSAGLARASSWRPGLRGGGAASAGTALDGRPAQWTSSSAREAAIRFRLGEDVVHAAFGEGVVTGVEPDGVIVVRFAGDGSERKLMAEYAPVSRR